jgi:hypothetical protein
MESIWTLYVGNKQHILKAKLPFWTFDHRVSVHLDGQLVYRSPIIPATFREIASFSLFGQYFTVVVKGYGHFGRLVLSVNGKPLDQAIVLSPSAQNSITPFNSLEEETIMDPITIVTLISSGLKLVDQFREMALRVKGTAPAPPSGKAEQAGSALEVRHGEQVLQRVEASDLKMDEWDVQRYEALSKRIRKNWGIFNDLFVSEAGASAQEGARIRAEMRELQEVLCRDFREIVKLYERTLSTSLPDHYQLYEVCSA